MLNRRLMMALATASVATLGQGAYAQADYPTKPIRIVLPFAPGSGADNNLRQITAKVAEQTGWTLIVDNKPGGNSFIGVNDFVRTPVDGYTLLYSGGTTHGVNSALFKQLPYDPIKDMVPVHFTGFSPMVLVASPALKVENAGQLVDLIRKNPGKYSAATGSPFQVLAVNLFKQETDLKFQDVSYKGSAQSLTDLIGGHVDFAVIDVGAVMPMVRSGMIKPLAVTAGQRLGALPDTPTMKESGLPDIHLSGWAALFAKTGTPEPVIEKLRAAFGRYLKSPEYEKFITDNGGFNPSLTPEQMSTFIRSEIERAKTTFERAGIKPQ